MVCTSSLLVEVLACNQMLQVGSQLGAVIFPNEYIHLNPQTGDSLVSATFGGCKASSPWELAIIISNLYYSSFFISHI